MRDFLPTGADAFFARHSLRWPWFALKLVLVPLGAWAFVMYWVEKIGPWTAAWALGFPLVFGFIEGLQRWRASHNR